MSKYRPRRAAIEPDLVYSDAAAMMQGFAATGYTPVMLNEAGAATSTVVTFAPPPGEYIPATRALVRTTKTKNRSPQNITEPDEQSNASTGLALSETSLIQNAAPLHVSRPWKSFFTRIFNVHANETSSQALKA